MKALFAVALPFAALAVLLTAAAPATPPAPPTMIELEEQVAARVDARVRVHLAKLAAETRASSR